MGLLPPGINMPRPEIFSIFRSRENRKPPGDGTRPNFSRNKIRLANPAFRDDSGTSLRAPLLTPWSSPNRRFLVPMMAVSPLNRTLI